MLRLLTINLIQTCCLDENLKKQWQNSYCQNQVQENCLVLYTSTNNNNNLVPKDRLKSSSLQESPYLGPKKTGENSFMQTGQPAGLSRTGKIISPDTII